METNRVKLWSDGTLNKLKCRIVVQGYLQGKSTEDTWSPTASFQTMKMFLANATKNKTWVWQLDFVGAFLQASKKLHLHPSIYGELFPKFKQYCSQPLHLLKSMYGMMYSGKYWFQELREWLVNEGFKQRKTRPCLFWKVFPDGSVVKLLDYVNDILYFSTPDTTLKIFWGNLTSRFDVKMLGQAHWYLSMWISQDSDFSITIDQLYCRSITLRFIDTAGTKKGNRNQK